MATMQTRLTPVSDTTPATVKVTANEPSGAQWVRRFPGSREVDECESPFKENVKSFIKAMTDAGVTVRVSATFRPVERAYLMHWSWKIWKGEADPQKIPVKDGVLIKWDHVDAAGKYAKDASVAAATAMVKGFDIDDLGVAPALESEHTKRMAVDMTISWAGELTVQNAEGTDVKIKSTPRSGMNKDLHAVGASYGVIKYNRRGTDKPHWSSSGK